MIRQLGQVAALAVALVLCGCATVKAPTPGLSAAEEAVLRAQSLELNWATTGLPPEMRPPEVPVEVVSREEWSNKFVACMSDAGFDNYTAVTDGFQRYGDAESDGERIANFVCEASYTVPAEQYGYLNPAQQEYVYDYFVEVLVPCLQDRGVEPRGLPTREQFLNNGWSWNPYEYVESNFQERPFSDRQLRRDCAPLPPGVFNDGRFE